MKNTGKYLFLVACYVCIIGYYVYWFRFDSLNELSKDPGSWGQFGDYVGGILNPVIASAAFIWLAKSVEIQSVELVETRKALTDAAISQREMIENAAIERKLNACAARLNAISTQYQLAARDHEFYIQQLQNHNLKYYYSTDGSRIDRNDLLTKCKASESIMKLAADRQIIAANDLEIFFRTQTI